MKFLLVVVFAIIGMTGCSESEKEQAKEDVEKMMTTSLEPNPDAATVFLVPGEIGQPTEKDSEDSDDEADDTEETGPELHEDPIRSNKDDGN